MRACVPRQKAPIYLSPCPRRDGHAVVEREAEAVDVVVEQQDRVHRTTEAAEVLDAQTAVALARLAVQPLREELLARIEKVDDRVGVGLAGGGPDDQLKKK